MLSWWREPKLNSSISSSSNNQAEAEAEAEAEFVKFVKCDCCALTEECTPAYIAKVRERHAGRWVCGLCSEAVEDEIVRSGRQHPIATEEALRRHRSFLRSFRSPSKPPPDPKERLISAMRQLLRRGFASPRAARAAARSRGAPDTIGNAAAAAARTGPRI